MIAMVSCIPCWSCRVFFGDDAALILSRLNCYHYERDIALCVPGLLVRGGLIIILPKPGRLLPVIRTNNFCWCDIKQFSRRPWDTSGVDMRHAFTSCWWRPRWMSDRRGSNSGFHCASPTSVATRAKTFITLYHCPDKCFRPNSKHRRTWFRWVAQLAQQRWRIAT